MIRPIVALALTATATAHADPKAAALQTSIAVMTVDNRAVAEKALAAKLGAGAEVQVDFAGFPRWVTIPLPAPVAEADRVAYALAFVRAHAAIFGVVRPGELGYESDSDIIRIGAGPRWTGQIAVSYDGAKLSIGGHLWPIETPDIRVSPAVQALVKPYYGKHAVFLSRCLDKCHDSDEILGERSFGFAPGLVFLCNPAGAIAIRQGVYIERKYRRGASVDGMTLPVIVDARTGKNLIAEADEFMMPIAGAAVAGGSVKFGFERVGPGHCFDD